MRELGFPLQNTPLNKKEETALSFSNHTVPSQILYKFLHFVVNLFSSISVTYCNLLGVLHSLLPMSQRLNQTKLHGTAQANQTIQSKPALSCKYLFLVPNQRLVIRNAIDVANAKVAIPYNSGLDSTYYIV